MRFQVGLVLLLACVPWAHAEPESDPGTDRIVAQWPLDAVGARGLAEQGIDGSGILVAVLDSGIDHTHPDLAGRFWINAGEVPDNGIDDDLNGYIDDVEGWDMCHDAPVRQQPPFYHGTFVAGVIAADGRGHDGVLGVAPGAQIMDVQVFCDDDTYAAGDPLGFDPDAVREGLAYAIDHGADIIQLSLQRWPDRGPGLVGGLLQAHAGIAEEFQRAHDQGILVVAAAGNLGERGPSSPADMPHVISVGATTGCGPRHTFSNHGPQIDIWAPGRALSTWSGGYGWDAGTSFAAPMVAGAAALLLQQEPGLSPDAVKQRLLQAAMPLEDGPGLDLRPLFGTPPAAVPGGLRHAGPTLVGDLHYLQFVVTEPAPLLQLDIPGAGQWCFDNATMEPIWIRVNQLPQPATVSARLHNGAVAGEWLNITFAHNPDLPDGEERPLLVGLHEVPADRKSPGPLAALALLTALLVRRR